MAKFLPKPAAATAGSDIPIELLKGYGKLDVTQTRTGRYHSALGNASNNFIGGAIVTDAAPAVEYKISFTLIDNTTMYWTYATQAARDTSYTDDVVTPLTTDPEPEV